jgi:hypothetical protein
MKDVLREFIAHGLCGRHHAACMPESSAPFVAQKSPNVTSGNLAALAAKARVEQITFLILKRGADFNPLISNRMQWGSLRAPHQGPCDPQDPICAAAHLRSVSHANACHFETFEAIIDVFLVVNVEMRCALVQKEDSRLSIECSREHHSLLLPA